MPGQNVAMPRPVPRQHEAEPERGEAPMRAPILDRHAAKQPVIDVGRAIAKAHSTDPIVFNLRHVMPHGLFSAHDTAAERIRAV